MRKLPLPCLVLLTAALLTAPGCVELDGQRLTWFYDAAKDELQILIHYDGIHEADTNSRKGTEQIPKFVKDGDVMLLDWPLHIEMADVRKLQRENAEPLEKEWARLITSIKTQPVGYYREPNGHIGAAQLVTIPKAKRFIRKLNKLLSAAILEEKLDPESPMNRTPLRMQAAAKAGHRWLRLDGQAIRFSMPVHPDEWRRMKGEFFRELGREIANWLRHKGNKDQRDVFRLWSGLLASAPLSYIDKGDRVEFVLGLKETPTTLRARIHDEYEPSLEKVVIDNVKLNLDQRLADKLLDETTELPPPFSHVLAWGPPEDQVRALLLTAETGSDEMRQAAIERLRSWAKQWNRDHRAPKAPAEMDKPDDYLAAWKQWYARKKEYCVIEVKVKAKKPDAPKGEKPAARKGEKPAASKGEKTTASKGEKTAKPPKAEEKPPVPDK